MSGILKRAGRLTKAGLLSGCLALFGTGCDRLSPSGSKGDGSFKLAVVRDPGAPGELEVVVTSTEAWIDVVDPLKIEWESVLSLRLINEESGAESPMLGTYDLRPFDLHFKPVYPLLPGRKYVARFDVASLPGFEGAPPHEMVTSYESPNRHLEGVPQVVAFYPSGTEVPENQLRFYIEFSEPMERGKVFEHLGVMGKDGIEVPDPFRESEEWSEDGKLLTVWLNPERQLKGSDQNRELGPVLREGVDYRVVVSGVWKSEEGVPIGKDYEKLINAGPADLSRVNTSEWEVTAPPRLTKDRLKVKLPETYDWAHLKDKLRMETVDGDPIEGAIEVGVKERTWFFTPEKEWRPGNYRIAVPTTLEDLAGNSLAQVFEFVSETDVGDGGTGSGAVEEAGDEVYVTFRIR